jgi:hypothetical protein
MKKNSGVRQFGFAMTFSQNGARSSFIIAERFVLSRKRQFVSQRPPNRTSIYNKAEPNGFYTPALPLKQKKYFIAVGLKTARNQRLKN